VSDGIGMALAVLVACSTLASCADERYAPLRAGDRAPSFEAITLAGEPFTIGGSSDEAVLVNVWATWCIPCREEMPALQQLHERFHDEGLRVIGVNIDAGGDGLVRSFLGEYGVTYLNLRDRSDRITPAYRLVGVPETILIGRDGRVVHRWIGRFDPLSELSLSIMREALGGRPATESLQPGPAAARTVDGRPDRDGSIAERVQRAAFDLAITVDHLPWTAASSIPAEVVTRGTTRILDAFLSRGITATGFIVCDAMAARPGQVERWAEAGQSLGNHTQSHPDLNTTPVQPWLDGVEKCDEAIRAAGADPRYFRYPMLHRGPDVATRAAAAADIEALGYISAPVTIDNSEWILASAYERAALDRDEERLESIAALYVEHIRRATAHARDVARQRFGREVRHILLLHANRLNADRLPALLDALADDGARFVSLEDALADPVYGLDDGYIGPRGLSWLYRVAPAQPELGEWDEAEEARVSAALARRTSGPS
jgi:peptidoglycan/xylan/chitin deacetylase (PgdA/CDA1 family)/peroxiredoxin